MSSVSHFKKRRNEKGMKKLNSTSVTKVPSHKKYPKYDRSTLSLGDIRVVSNVICLYIHLSDLNLIKVIERLSFLYLILLLLRLL